MSCFCWKLESHLLVVGAATVRHKKPLVGVREQHVAGDAAVEAGRSQHVHQVSDATHKLRYCSPLTSR